MVASNELDPEYIVDTAKMLFTLAGEIHDKLGIDFEFVNIGGGIGIPYKPDQKAMDLERVGSGIRDAYAELVEGKGMKPIRLYMERRNKILPRRNIIWEFAMSRVIVVSIAAF